MKGVAELQLNLRVRQVKTGGKGEKGLCIFREIRFGNRRERREVLGKNSGIWGHGSSFLKLHTDSRSMSCTGTLHILGELFSGFWNCSSSSRAASTPIWRKS